MQKKFVGNLLLLLFLNFLIKPLWILGIDRSVQNRVGPDEYGLYFALFNISIVFNILLDLGLTHYNNQAVSRNKTEVVRNFSYLSSLKIILGFLYVLVTLIAGYVAGYDSMAFGILGILAINQFLASMILFLRSNLSGMQYYWSDSIISVLDKSLMIVICGVLMYTSFGPREFGIVEFALSQLASYIIATLIAFFMVLKKVKVFSWRFDFTSFKNGLRKSMPYALLILLMALYTRVDGIMLDRMVGAYQSGIYAAAFRLLDMVNQISYLFGMLLLPMFANMIGKNENISPLTRLSFNLVFTLSLAIALSGFVNADFIIDYLYDNKDVAVNESFKWLMLSSVAFATTFIFGTLLTALKKLRILNVIALSGFVVNILLNWILIPNHGAEGASWATFATQGVTTLLQAFYAFRYADIKFPKGYIYRFGGFLTFSVAAAYSVGTLSVPSISKVLAIFVLIILLSLTFRMLNYQVAIDMLRKRFK